MKLLDLIPGVGQARGVLQLVGLVAAVTAIGGLWAWGAAGHADARAIDGEAELVCAAASASFAPTSSKPGGKVKKADRGKACLEAVRQLASFKNQATAGSNQVLADAAKDQVVKTGKDAARAAKDAAESKAAARNMEIREDAVQADQVDPDWFDALNRVGGLRDDGA